jgi:type IV secretory pathway VirB3-like protein
MAQAGMPERAGTRTPAIVGTPSRVFTVLKKHLYVLISTANIICVAILIPVYMVASSVSFAQTL